MEHDVEWMGHACQQRAVLVSIRKPMTCREIFAAAVELTPRIRLRDVSSVLRQLMVRGYVRCISRQPVTGSLYCLTLPGRRQLDRHLHIARAASPRSVEWEMYSYMARGTTRKAVFQELRRLQTKTGEPQTISRVRRSLTAKHPITLNATIRAMNELLDIGAVACVERTNKGGLRLFAPTDAGERIGEVLDM